MRAHRVTMPLELARALMGRSLPMSHMLKATHMVGKSVSKMKIKVVKVSLLMQCDLCTKVTS